MAAAASPVYFAIEPVAPGQLRLVLQAQGDLGAALVFSRSAYIAEIFPQSCYRWWGLDSGATQPGFFDAFMRLPGVTIATGTDSSECLLDIRGLSSRMTQVEQPRLIYGDPRRLGLASDPTFEVETASFVDAVAFLRGRGRRVGSGVMVDVVIHGSLPVRHDGKELAHVRVLTLKRVDTQARIDIVARCAPLLLESTGLRFSLAPLVAAMQHLRGVVDGDGAPPILSVGFDIEEHVVWVGRMDPGCAAFCWKQDPAMQAMSARPVAV